MEFRVSSLKDGNLEKISMSKKILHRIARKAPLYSSVSSKVFRASSVVSTGITFRVNS